MVKVIWYCPYHMVDRTHFSDSWKSKWHVIISVSFLHCRYYLPLIMADKLWAIRNWMIIWIISYLTRFNFKNRKKLIYENMINITGCKLGRRSCSNRPSVCRNKSVRFQIWCWLEDITSQSEISIKSKSLRRFICEHDGSGKRNTKINFVCEIDRLIPNDRDLWHFWA